MGIVHHVWQPIPKEFDDYIARPKPNGYQSLHTVVMDSEGVAFEVQPKSDTFPEGLVMVRTGNTDIGVPVHYLSGR